MTKRQNLAIGMLLAISCTSPTLAEETKSPSSPAASTATTAPSSSTAASTNGSTAANAAASPAAPSAEAKAAASTDTKAAASTQTAPASTSIETKATSASAPAETSTTGAQAPVTGTYAEHLAAGKAAVAASDSHKAIVEFRAALALAEKANDDFHIAESCNELANVYIAKNDILNATTFAKRAKDTAIRVLFSDPKTQDLAKQLRDNEENGSIWISHVMQAEFAAQKKDYPTAEAQYQAAISQAQQYAADGMPMATALTGLGKTYVAEGKYKEAEPVLRKAIDLCEKNWTPVTKSAADDGADAMERLSVVLENTGRKAEAEKMAAKSKQVRENKSFH